MNPHPSLEQATSYLDLQLSRPRGHPMGVHHEPEGPFVTLSRQSGTGASDLARLLAEVLNSGSGRGSVPWTVFDHDIVEHVLRDQHLSPRLARFLPEDGMHEISGSVGEIVGLHPNLWALAQRTKEFMRAASRHGHAILVGRGGNFATTGIGGGVHVRLVAPESARIRRIAQQRSLSHEDARAVVKKTDAARQHYVRSVFDRDVTEVTAYDLLVNTAHVSAPRIVTMIANLVGSLAAASAAST